MEILTEKNVSLYFKENVFPHLDFVERGKIKNFEEVGGGLVSRVFRLVIDGRPIFLKQALSGERKYYNFFKKVPKDLDFIFNENRQIYEAKALRIFEAAVGYGIAPHLYYHDVKNKILVLSEVCSSKARLFEDIIDKEINLEASKKLARIAAELVNNTYGKIKPIRPYQDDRKVKLTKLKYQCLEVYSKLESRLRKLVKKAQEDLVKESMKINKVLVHGDYHPRNILVEDGKVGTVDLEEAHLGDPAFDIGILIGSYLLRAVYHPKIRKKAKKAVIEMINIFLKKVKIPENKKNLEKRIKNHAGGLMLARIDGIFRWTKWVKSEAAKKRIREKASSLILNFDTSLPKLIDRLF